MALFFSFWYRWKSNFTQLLNTHGDTDVRQTEIHVA